MAHQLFQTSMVCTLHMAQCLPHKARLAWRGPGHENPDLYCLLGLLSVAPRLMRSHAQPAAGQANEPLLGLLKKRIVPRWQAGETGQTWCWQSIDSKGNEAYRG